MQTRLLNVAKMQGVDFNQVLVRFALERILYRLSRSEHADQFLLKGALLFTLWYDMPHRPTRDTDLLGFGPSDLESIGGMFREIAGLEVDDGIRFDPATVSVEEIRKEAGYFGARVLISGEIAKARCRTQIDIGFGDAVTPGPVHAIYPVLIDDIPAPRLRTYPVYTVVSEKLHAIALLGMTNSRLKDYLDIWVLFNREILNAHTLARAIAATFLRRGMEIPLTLPIGLSDEFANDASRQSMWLSFLRKNRLAITPLSEVVTMLRVRLALALLQARTFSLSEDREKIRHLELRKTDIAERTLFEFR